MKTIIEKYQALYKATSGKISVEKSYLYYWKWVYQNGIKVIQNIDCKIVLNGEELKQIGVEKSIRSLGLHITPSLE